MTARPFRGNCLITGHEQVAEGIMRLRFSAPEIADPATPGQFVNVYLPGGEMLLPRPISIADAQGGDVTLIYAIVGGGTKALSGIGAGECLEVMGPLGTGFLDYTAKEKIYKNILLIGGGVGIPPLFFTARRLRELYGQGVRIHAYLGFRESPWYLPDFKEICDEARCSSETGEGADVHGNVIDLLCASAGAGTGAGEDADADAASDGAMAFACGPRPMLEAAREWCRQRGIPLRISLEARMCCGYGACAACTAKTRLLDDPEKPQKGPAFADAEGIVRKKVCVHGPVFWADEVIW